MSFELKSVVPWGRTLMEYKQMFSLTPADLNKKIISFGDGPASFNKELTEQNGNCISIDPIYQFSKEQLETRFEEVREEILEQVKSNAKIFIWKIIKNIEELDLLRTQAMHQFLKDFDSGLIEGRYLMHQLPEKTHFKDKEFELGLSSHFLILYEKLGLEFHLKSLTEMMRICKKVRTFPLLNLNAEKSEVLEPIIKHFSEMYEVKIEQVNYEFQKGGNQMLVMKNIE
ncbi:SAM-dependent methyltransferase [Chondrinema litorale]|uniref:SAM-dependent methyltransferase n=1 Tax=Chondrinema litorale TaxID=2994555 RepID=UPI002542EF98|nr:SAM-dependent methyltransferase [Chondrinema litorale]UZR96155.1 SAM-dependent methyltransferase [Chondrinema litorale]